MALIKATPTEFGVDATYWHILAVQVDRVQAVAQVTMAGYLDAAARAGGCRPVAVATLTLGDGDFPGNGDGLRYEALYERLKGPRLAGGPSPFADAEDA
ncbi:hypothetical protein [Azospirillum sp.]|uniref:hypothetical protein n=1 Tax=Azospirillum sp. TaxID=34012 RepID=UPI002D3EC660|nr:hypothetical protein [Azospirillum sp.]HYD63885.1 hypothetical protein [Azospirillum sp.]